MPVNRKSPTHNFRKHIKKYRLTDDKKQEEDALRYWASKSIKQKIDAMEQIMKNFYAIQGTNLNEQRLQRVLKVVTLS